jgi:hypothetical protein
MTLQRLKLLLILIFFPCALTFGQIYEQGVSQTGVCSFGACPGVVTGVSPPMRSASLNQFHQLTMIPYNVTGSSCAGGFTGVIRLEASTDLVTWFPLGLNITAAAVNTGTYTSAAGSFAYVRINYVSGNTSSCLVSAWYSGTTTGYPSFNTPVVPTPPVPIAGNPFLYSGQQAVTATAVALPTQTTKQVCLKTNVLNSINVYVGPAGVTTSTGQELAPDESLCLPVGNLNLMYVVASTTGATVTWTATN